MKRSSSFDIFSNPLKMQKTDAGKKRVASCVFLFLPRIKWEQNDEQKYQGFCWVKPCPDSQPDIPQIFHYAVT